MFYRKSMIETYRWCPRQYKLVYIEGHTIPVTYAMTIGTRFHDFVEDYFNLSSPATITLEHYLEHEKPLYEWFLSYEQIRRERCKNYFPYAREIKLESERLNLSGTIDRIDKENDNTFTIVEYKTGKKIDDNSIMRQCSLYKLLIEDALNIPISRYRAINPRIQEIREYEPVDRFERGVMKDIEKIEGDCLYKPSCSLFKHPYCAMCKLDELIEEGII